MPKNANTANPSLKPQAAATNNAKSEQKKVISTTNEVIQPKMKKIECPPIIALPRNDFDPNDIHTEVDYGAGKSGGCHPKKPPANCPNSKNGAPCAKTVIDKDREMAIKQAKVAASVGDLESAKASAEMANKVGTFKPLPIIPADKGQENHDSSEDSSSKNGSENLQREAAPKENVVQSTNVPIGRDFLFIEEEEKAERQQEKHLPKHDPNDPNINNDAMDEDTTLDERDPAIARLLNPALKKNTVYDEANTAIDGKKDPRVTADNPVGTKLTDIDTSGDSKQHMATMTICVNESSMELIKQLFLSVAGPDVVMECKPAHSNRNWEDPEGEDPENSKPPFGFSSFNDRTVQ